MLAKSVEKRCLLAQLHQVLLLVDELVDDGIVMDLELNSIMSKITGSDKGLAGLAEGMPLGEQTVAQVLQSAKEFKWGSILK